jgi:hypothetical protein
LAASGAPVSNTVLTDDIEDVLEENRRLTERLERIDHRLEHIVSAREVVPEHCSLPSGASSSGIVTRDSGKTGGATANGTGENPPIKYKTLIIIKRTCFERLCLLQ